MIKLNYCFFNAFAKIPLFVGIFSYLFYLYIVIFKISSFFLVLLYLVLHFFVDIVFLLEFF